MLRDPHQFYVGIAHIFYIFHDRVGEFPVCIEPFVIAPRMPHPGAHMHFIDGHRIHLVIPGLPALHPCAVRPFQMRNIRHPGSGSRPQLRIVCKWIRLEDPFALLRLNTELIQRALLYTRHKTGVDPERFLAVHIVGLKIPAVKIAHYGNPAGMRRPHCKIDALFAFTDNFVRAHLLIDLIVVALSEEILVQFADLKGLRFFLFCAFFRFHKATSSLIFL